MKKLIQKIIFITIIAVISIIINMPRLHGAQGSMNFGLRSKTTARETETYLINSKPIFKVVKYNQAQVEAADNSSIYCLKAGPGFGSEGYDANVIEYTQNFDIKIPSAITPEAYKNQLPTNATTYNQLIWLLDHIYVSAKNGASAQEIELSNKSKTELLDNAGVANNSFLRTLPENEFNDIIEAIQQVAIWHFTNPADDPYNNPSIDNVDIKIKVPIEEKPEETPGEGSGNTTETGNTTEGGTGEEEPEEPEEPAETPGEMSLYKKYELDPTDNEINQIYTYLVDGAITEASKGYPYVGASEKPIKINSDSVSMEIEGENYIIGPCRIEKNIRTEYTISARITDGYNEIRAAKILNHNKEEVTTGNTIADKLDYTMGDIFYISVPLNLHVPRIKLDINGNAEITKQTLWTTGESSLTTNQPIVIVEKDIQDYKDTLQIETPQRTGTYNLKIFSKDEADAKGLKETLFIAKVNGVIQNLETDESGSISIIGIDIENIEQDDIIEVQEIRPPTGYTAVLSTPTIITVKKILLEEEGKEEPTPALASVIGSNTVLSTEGGISTIVYTAYNRKIPGEYKLRLIKNDNKNGRPLSGAKFNICINGGLLQEYTTNDSGEINISKIGITDEGEDTIEIEETKPPVGYKANTEKITLKVTKEIFNDTRYIATSVTGNDRAQLIQATDKNNIVLLRVENEKSDDSYNLKIVKTDADNSNKRLPNAKFKVTFYEQSQGEPETDIVEESLEYTTNSKGEIVIPRGIVGENLTGKIKIEEIEAPDGYDIGTNGTINLTFNTVALENKLLINNVRDENGNARLSFDMSSQLIEVNVNNKVQKFDLALRQFITKINDKDVETSREPQVDSQEIANLANGRATYDSGTTALKPHIKEPLKVARGDKIIYTIRIYNEGKASGYAKEITEYLPEGLELVPQSESATNTKYGWKEKENNRTVSTNYLQSTAIQGLTSSKLSYKDVQMECRVTKKCSQQEVSLKNVVEITAEEDVNGNMEDVDSEPEDLSNSQKNSYEARTSARGKGYEDDDDYEEVIMQKEDFDLALRKFITHVNEIEVENRTSIISDLEKEKLSNKEATFDNGTTALKTHKKTPVLVRRNDKVIYTIRIYNEGKVDGYAREITDYLPEGLDLVPNSESTINTQYGWTVSSDNNRKVTTRYLQGELIEGINGKVVSYKEVKIECLVTKRSEGDNTTLKNIAEISYAEDIDGNSNDVDSTSSNLTTEQINQYNVSTSDRGKGYEDDDDYEEISISKEYFDLALRKFIVQINNKNIEGREPTVTEDEIKKLSIQSATLDNGTTALKTSVKTPIVIETGDRIIYTIRVYNEGNISGYAKEITDYLPEGLELVTDEDSTINSKYGWKVDSTNNRRLTTTYLQNELIEGVESTGLKYKDVQIECKVTKNPEEKDISLKNVAEITKAEDTDGKSGDTDSTINNLTDSQKNQYSAETSVRGKGYEDDDDYEEVVLLKKYFDLALRQFVTKVNNTNITNREPQVTSEEINKLAINKATFDEGTTAEKTSVKTPIVVETGDKIVYTIRIYNEGNINGYAKEVADYLPEGLELVANSESEINTRYGWDVDSNNNRKITTTYLQNELISNVTSSNLSYKDIQVECKVTRRPEEQNISLKSIAEITRLEDVNGNTKDIDSAPNNLTDEQKNNYNPESKTRGKGYQDDDDYEEVVMLRKYFDLSLRKFITKINNTSITNRESQITSQEIDKLSKEEATLDNGTTAEKTSVKTPIVVETGDKIVYTIRIYNEGNINGYAKEITEYLPEGLELVASSESEINAEYGWKVNDRDKRKITTNYLQNEVINSVTSTNLSHKDIKIECKVTRKPEEQDISFKNVAEITRIEDVNGNTKDIDSAPNNLTDEQKNNYNPESKTRGKGYQDDDDYEEVVMLRKYFDLSLRKFITKVNTTNITDREPRITAEEINKLSIEEATFDEGTTAEKTSVKTPIVVETGDKIVYTIRVYNEGSLNGYAKEITDYLPEGLELVASSESAINAEYGWTADNNNNRKVTTNYLQDEVINSVTSTNLSHKDIKIECKVIRRPEEQNISFKSVAEITRAEDVNGNTKDIDSTPNNLTDEQKNGYNPESKTRGKGYEDDDDYEEVVLLRKYFDLSLRKFITKVNTTNITDREPRITAEEINKLSTEEATFDEGTTAEKTNVKTPIVVETGDKIVYTIRVYNEGSLNGYAKEITDYLPEGLELVASSESEVNAEYGWNIDGSDNRKVTTNYLQDEVINSVTSTNLSHKDIKIECKVTRRPEEQNISFKSVAEITRAEDVNGNTKDIDSTPNNLTNEQKNNYNPESKTRGKGYQDDDDYEEVVMLRKYFDLSLRKFVTKVNTTNITDREPRITAEEINKLSMEEATFDEGTTAEKTNVKTPIVVETGDKIVYTIRVYNEGSLNGYAKEITDYLPEGLELVASSESEVNAEYGWNIDGSDNRKVTTNYLKDKIINSVTSTNLNHKDIKIECKVTRKPEEQNISFKNVAEITRAEDVNGNTKDIDSTPNNLTEEQKNNYNPESKTRGKGYQDDDDYEEVVMLRKYFDLSLRKFITKVNDTTVTNRVPQITSEEISKLSIEEASLDNGNTPIKTSVKTPIVVETGNKIVYTIRVYNEGSLSGYAKEITDYLPEGLELVANSESEINTRYGWTADNNNNRKVTTNYLQNELINSVTSTNISYKDIQIECQVTRRPEEQNIYFKNVAEITRVEDVNGKTKDIDSTANNITEVQRNNYNPETKAQGRGYEDDDDYEEVVLLRKYFDLSLRKFVTKVNDTAITNREPQISSEEISKLTIEEASLDNGNTPIKTSVKTPIVVETGDKIVYTIRVYNEGSLNGYAKEITDYLPEGLELVDSSESETNTEYGWTVDGSDKRKITTNYLQDKLINSITNNSLSHKDIQIECKVTKRPEEQNISFKNVAEITRIEDINGNTKDVDSTPNNITEGQKNNYNPETKEQGKGYEDDDDYEEVVMLRKYFDLSLRKFVTKVNDTAITNREPQITSEEINKLSKEEATFDNGTTAEKTSIKTPIVVETEDKIVYTIRVYNEGSLNGYAKEIADYLPEGLELVASSESEINAKYGWTVDSNNNRKVTTNYLQNELINSVASNTISYKDIQIECKVTKRPEEQNISFKNVAEIAKAEDLYGNIRDIDSETNNLTDEQKNQYNVETSQRGKGYQDDDDYEEVVMLRKYFDLSLRKFVTKVNDTAITNREPQITSEEINKLSKEEAAFDNGTTVEKTHTKRPIAVEKGYKVVYTIRIYNEGSLKGYAKEITEYLPEGLELVANSESTINSKYGWVADSRDSKKVTTTYLQDELIESTSASKINYRDIQIECRVTKETEEQKISLKSITEITKVEDLYGNTKDIDSTVNNLTNEQKSQYKPETSDKGKGYEDDDDYEEVIIRGRYFDLALRKFITKINNQKVENREPEITQEEALNLIEEGGGLDNGTTALKTHTKTPLAVEEGDKVTYTIRIYNEGTKSGYAKEIADYLPEGLELVPDSESTTNSKYGWKVDSNNKRKVTTTYLQNQSIEGLTTSKFDFKDIEIECKVVKEAEEQNVYLKNIAEITKIEDTSGSKKDTDSTANNLKDDQKNQYKPEKSEQGKGYEDDDDYEELVIKGRYFDLSLRKFITAINDNNITNRQPIVDVEPLLKGETTANYNHTKEPLEVEIGSIVTYTIRVYNEGTINGYANKIVEHLPPELEFLTDDPVNIEYGWKKNDDRTVETEYLKNTLITAFDMTGNELDYKDIKVRCKVKESAPYLKQITNIVEIAESRNSLNIPDRDNKKKVEIPDDNNLQNYKKEDLGKEYIPGQEDDDDFEKVILKKFDLALRKFITSINNQEVSDRIPQVDTSKYGQMGTQGQVVTNFEYNHSKEPVRVSNNDIVVYTIRIYNEGTKSGYAKEIKDNIPEGLTFIPENEINKQYKWKMYDESGNETNEISKATNLRSNYLSKENEANKGANLLKEYNKETMQEADYKDVKVAFKVSTPSTSDRIIINKAEISKDSDENGNEVPDIDSNPEEWTEGEDDQDIEKIYVQYFDLALRKWVNQVVVIEDGLEKVKDTNHYAEQDPEPVVKVDLNQKRIDNTVIKFKYSIRVANEGEIPGYAVEISDYIPDGLAFSQADNPLWKESDGKITTDQLKNKLLNPGETKTVEVTLTWINGGENMGNVMKNIAEISKDKNDSNTPDIDSTPNNQKEGEDDIDDAPVALTMVTGKAPTYIAISLGVLAVVAGGVFLIKKYVV